MCRAAHPEPPLQPPSQPGSALPPRGGGKPSRFTFCKLHRRSGSPQGMHPTGPPYIWHFRVPAHGKFRDGVSTPGNTPPVVTSQRLFPNSKGERYWPPCRRMPDSKYMGAISGPCRHGRNLNSRMTHIPCGLRKKKGPLPTPLKMESKRGPIRPPSTKVQSS